MPHFVTFIWTPIASDLLYWCHSQEWFEEFFYLLQGMVEVRCSQRYCMKHEKHSCDMETNIMHPLTHKKHKEWNPNPVLGYRGHLACPKFIMGLGLDASQVRQGKSVHLSPGNTAATWGHLSMRHQNRWHKSKKPGLGQGNTRQELKSGPSAGSWSHSLPGTVRPWACLPPPPPSFAFPFWGRAGPLLTLC